MTKELRNKIKQILKDNANEAYSCLYPPSGWEWGSGSRKYTRNTVNLMNKILSQIPESAWPEDFDEHISIKSGRWTLRLDFTNNKMTADLSHSSNNHTAWVINRGKKFINFDIGGS